MKARLTLQLKAKRQTIERCAVKDCPNSAIYVYTTNNEEPYASGGLTVALCEECDMEHSNG
jgi:hypothetical protein